MSATSAPAGRGYDRTDVDRTAGPADAPRRLSTKTKAAFKTTEFAAYVAVLVGILVAGVVAKASNYGGHDPFRADRVWLFATILTVGYMLSRGLAKAGSGQPNDERS